MLKRKIIMQILLVLLIQFILGATVFGDSITLTDAEQAIGAVIGYQYPLGTDNIVEEQLVPDPPKGLGNADYDIDLNHYGVSVSASLNSIFSENQVTAEGYSNMSAYWGEQPWFGDDDAIDVHGGAGPTFRLSFTEGASPVYVSITGEFNINMDVYADLNPMETSASITLSEEGNVIWHNSLDGTNGQPSKIVGYGLWLETGQNYELQAFTEAGTHASYYHPALHSRTASFSLIVTWEPGCVVPDVFNQTEADAEAILEAAGLVKGVVTYESSDIIEAGRVISQSPDSDTTVECGSAVDLVITTAEGCSVPNIIGMSEAQAENSLSTAGLVKGSVRYTHSNVMPAGHIISQSPAPGTTVECGSAVDLVISKGPKGGGGGGVSGCTPPDAEFLHPFHVGLKYVYSRSEGEDEWIVERECIGKITDEFEYYQLRTWNYDYNGEYDGAYVRSTEGALYSYNPGDEDYLEFQKAPVGTTWTINEPSDGYTYKVIELVGIEKVSVPYGTFCAYKHRKYRSDGSGSVSPAWYEWIVPGVGIVMEFDLWTDNPPAIMKLVSVYSELEEKMTSTLAFFDESVTDGTLEGAGKGKGKKQLNDLKKILEAASELIEGGYNGQACEQLTDAHSRCDGDTDPPDYVIGPATDSLAAMIQDLSDCLGCE